MASTATMKMEDRRKAVEKYIRRGFDSHDQIAAALNVSRQTITLDIAAIYEQWQERDPEESKVKLQRRLRQLEAVQQELWNAYERSLSPLTEVTRVLKHCTSCGGEETEQGATPCRTCGGEGFYMDVSRKRKNQQGDPAILAMIKDVVKEMARLEGAYATRTLKVSHDGSVGHLHAHAVIGLPDSDGRYAGAPLKDLEDAYAAIARLKVTPPAIIDGTADKGD